MKAQFKCKDENITIELDVLEEMQLKKEGRRGLVSRIKNRVWTSLKLRGESVTMSEIKFIKMV